MFILTWIQFSNLLALISANGIRRTQSEDAAYTNDLSSTERALQEVEITRNRIHCTMQILSHERHSDSSRSHIIREKLHDN